MDKSTNSKSPLFRPIMPAPTAAGAAEASSSQPPVPRRKRPAISMACNACRRHKTKCSGGRPICDACTRRQVHCEYDKDPDETLSTAVKRKYQELQRQRTPYQRIFDALRSRPEADAAAIVRKIRRGERLDDIAREVEHGDLLLQTAVSPETRFRYEFPCAPGMPRHLVARPNRYLGSLIYEWALPGTASAVPERWTDMAELYAPYLKPYHAAEIMDARLSALVPSKWTTVCADDVLMRRLLHAFFLQDHDWWTAFQKDYFLEDMANMRHRLCTPLLVNAMLALSCNYYRGLADRAEFWNPKTLGYRFLAEAKRLWEYEMHKDTLTTVQAALLLHVVYSGAGADTIGVAYMKQACAMALNLDLFLPGFVELDSRLREARHYTAWAVVTSFHYFRPPLIKKPPPCDLPRPKEDACWYGELWLRYPLNKSLYASSSGAVFKAKAEFAVILNDMGQVVFSGPAHERDPSAAQVICFYKRFTGWFANLPESLSPRKAVLPTHLKLHMHYFQIVRRLLQAPSVNDGADGHAMAMNMLGQAPREIVSDANASLEALLRAYYLRHGFETLDSYMIALLMESCLLAIEAAAASQSNDAALRSTIVLLAKGLYEQGQNLFLGQLVFQLVRAKMDPAALSTLERCVKTEALGKKQAAGLEYVQMQWPVEITSMADDPESKRLQRLLDGQGDAPANDRAGTQS